MSGPKRRTVSDGEPDGGMRGSRVWIAGVAGAIVIALLVAVGAWYVVARGGDAGPKTVVLDLQPAAGERPKAVIVDQLSERSPDVGFVDASTARLRDAGYDVDYVAAAEVTVDFYRTLPEAGYRMILLRSHSARRVVENEKTDSATLFTTEPANIDEHHDELVGRRLGFVQYDDGPGDRFFGVRPEFIEQDMQGEFDPRTVVVLMGCDGLRSDRLAKAFVRRGAQSFVSWDEPVTAVATDRATAELIDRMLTPGATLADAVIGTMDEVGPDEQTGARLAYYPR